MANYKKISEIETVTEVTESMNVLIEDNGVLKKVSSGGNIGGGGVKTIVLVQDSYAPGEGYNNTTRICTCETGETYEDVLNYFNEETPFMILIKEIYDTSAGYTIASRVYPEYIYDDTYIVVVANQTFYWDRSTITITKPGSGGASEPE